MFALIIQYWDGYSQCTRRAKLTRALLRLEKTMNLLSLEGGREGGEGSRGEGGEGGREGGEGGRLGREEGWRKGRGGEGGREGGDGGREGACASVCEHVGS